MNLYVLVLAMVVVIQLLVVASTLGTAVHIRPSLNEPLKVAMTSVTVTASLMAALVALAR
ncbi:hypothetical protein GCM10009601_61230 [Streptomyces thermospinosisporus]|uniref:Uncharacterized protein n=1 Tax=Streptomyces thermospinosisporus TaxID=161482 RepID=A0ABN1Z7X0_9ACTN